MDEKQPKRQLFNTIFAASQISVSLAFMLMLLWMTKYESGYSWTSNPEKQFHYHPTLMFLGMVFITGDAIVVFRVLHMKTKRTTKLMHVVLHSITLIFVVVSLKAVADSHYYHRNNIGDLEPLPNLYSLHSWIGTIVIVAYFVQYAFGFMAFMYPGFSSSRRYTTMSFHRLFGAVIFVGIAATCLMGITEFSAWHHKCWVKDRTFCSEQGISNFVGLLLLLYVSLIMILTIHEQWRRKPLPEEGSLCENEVYEY